MVDARALLSRLGRSEHDAVLGEVLQRACAAMRAAWPTVALSDEVILDELAMRLPKEPDADLVTALSTLHVADLYLAWACARGLPQALAELEDKLLPSVLPAIGRLGDRDFVAEAAQRLRTKLFVADEGPPKIATYEGRGPLTAWLRATAMRTALNLLRRGRHDQPTTQAQESLELPGLAGDPDLELLRERCVPEFRAAFASAVGALEPRERNLLRLHFIDGLSIDELGALHEVHRATAARWIASARDGIFDRVRAELGRRLRLTDSEFDSLVGAVRSQLDLSIGRWLEK